MAVVFEGISLRSLSDHGDILQRTEAVLRLEVVTENEEPLVSIYNGANSQQMLRFSLSSEEVVCCQASKHTYLVNIQGRSVLLHFASDFELSRFHNVVKGAKHNSSKTTKKSVFKERTDEASSSQYFQFYGYLSQQQNMMQDYIRTSTYQKAMLQNSDDFRNKIVLDMGAGSAILSFFAIQAGAKKVYAIEASTIAEHAQKLVEANNLADRIKILAGKIEEVQVPEQVDIIISEPMGYMLFNERMLESYLHAKKFLKPAGKMFPTIGELHCAPFSDDAIYMEQFTKANFWYQQSFHGVNLTRLREEALQEYLRQPIVDTFDIRICLARSQKYTVDFLKAHETDLHRIEIPLCFVAHASGAVHGLAFWFDVAFCGTMQTVWLSTAPTEPLTHWYQVRCLLRAPIYIKQGQSMSGKVVLIANKRQSYDIDIELQSDSSGARSNNRLDLKNPFFHYTGQQPQPPTGSHETSPSEKYWDSVPQTAMVNGMADTNSMQVTPVQQGIGQSFNLIPLANAEPISHTGILPGGATQRQQTYSLPSSAGTLMSNASSLPFMQNGHQAAYTSSNPAAEAGGPGVANPFPVVAPAQFSIVGATDQLSLQPGTVIIQGQPGVQG
ncbi:histone-arginine methyltransferase CARMER-like [Acanthaster planci]|uniref:type I protein arginine methyltransferase n=1 Tax=Acanthaster planci TaxID=133434 RepID=A0A8B7Z3I9_ACAPL|nr:histone-arginine methyltransferase CARMER-like [Acanthaster planci]